MNGPEDIKIVECPECGGIAVEDETGEVECSEPGCDLNFSPDQDD